MKRLILATVLLVLGAVALVSGVALAWQLRARHHEVYTDAQSIRVPVEDATVRDVLWRPAMPLPAAINTEAPEYEPDLSGGDSLLLFVRGRPGGAADIYVCTREGELWTDPVPLVEVNSDADELGPELSPDGRQLFFYSDRAGGEGGYDLWVVQRTESGWGTPRNMGPQVNSRYHDYGPSLAPDAATLYFASNRPRPGDPPPPVDASPDEIRRDMAQRDYDVYASPVVDGQPQEAAPVEPLNSPFNDGAPAVSPAGDFIYFCSDRPDGEGGFDILRSRRLRGTHAPASNLGPTLNTAANEMDPAVSLAGFGLYFSSDRPTGPDPTGGYNLFNAVSREVFLETETMRAAVDWAAILGVILPFLLWLLIGVLLMLLLARLMQHRKLGRRLSLLARCAFASLAIHMLVLLVLSFVQVTASIANLMDQREGTQVRLVSSSTGSELSRQIRGNLTNVDLPQATSIASRQQTPMDHQVTASVARVSVTRAELPVEPRTPSEIQTTDAQAEVTPTPEVTRRSEVTPQQAVAVQMPRQPTRVDAAEPDTAPSPESTAAVAPQPAPSRQLATATAVTDPSVASPVSSADLQRHPSARQTLTAPSPATDAMAPVETLESEPSAVQVEFTAMVDMATPSAAEIPVERAGETPRKVMARVGSSPRQTSTSTVSPSAVDSSQVRVAPAGVQAPSPSPTFATPTLEPAAVPNAVALAPALALTPSDTPVLTPSAALPEQVEPTRAEPTTAAAPSQQPVRTTSSARTSVTGDVVEAPSSSTAVALAPQSATPPAMHQTMARVSQVEPIAPPMEMALPAPVADSPQTIPDMVAVDLPTAALDQPLPSSPKDASPSMDMKTAGAAREDTVPALRDEPQLHPIQMMPDWQEPVQETQSLAWSLDEIVQRGPSTPSVLVPMAVQTELPSQAQATTLEPISFDLSVPAVEVDRNDAYAQRAPEIREQLVERFGGSQETEAAVNLSLAWLARHQSGDGHWDSKRFDRDCGRCGGPAKVEADIALTGLSLLCFLAADHAPDKAGPYREVVQRGVDWLRLAQEPNGSLMTGESMYSHAIGTISLAEAYGMTRDPLLREPIELAVNFIYEARNRKVGGWRYDPGQVGDTSVLGWQVMALSSAKRAGIPIPEKALEVAENWLPKVRDPWKPGLYAYQPKRRPTPAMTAEALFVKQLLGFGRDSPETTMAVDYLMENPPKWDLDANTYYWYYASLALFQYGGDAWPRWNEAVKQEVLSRQIQRGNAEGSWDPDGKWALVGGRIYQTAMCTLILEVYYRYLPLYLVIDELEPQGTGTVVIGGPGDRR